MDTPSTIQTPTPPLDADQLILLIQNRDYEFAAHGYFSYPVERTVRQLQADLATARVERDEARTMAAHAEFDKDHYNHVKQQLQQAEARETRLREAVTGLVRWILDAEFQPTPPLPDGTLNAKAIFIKVCKIKAAEVQHALRTEETTNQGDE